MQFRFGWPRNCPRRCYHHNMKPCHRLAGLLVPALLLLSGCADRASAEDIVTLAVRRMLPNTRMGHSLLKRLKVYPGTEHPHTAQNPVKVEKL